MKKRVKILLLISLGACNAFFAMEDASLFNWTPEEEKELQEIYQQQSEIFNNEMNPKEQIITVEKLMGMGDKQLLIDRIDVTGQIFNSETNPEDQIIAVNKLMNIDGQQLMSMEGYEVADKTDEVLRKLQKIKPSLSKANLPTLLTSVRRREKNEENYFKFKFPEVQLFKLAEYVFCSECAGLSATDSIARKHLIGCVALDLYFSKYPWVKPLLEQGTITQEFPHEIVVSQTDYAKLSTMKYSDRLAWIAKRTDVITHLDFISKTK